MSRSIFAPTEKIIKRRVNARPLRRAFFMPYCQVIDSIIKISRLPMALSQNRIPYLNPSFDVFSVNGNGGNRFFLLPINRKNIMYSNPHATVSVSTKSLSNMENVKIYFNPSAFELSSLRGNIALVLFKGYTPAEISIPELILFLNTNYGQTVQNLFVLAHPPVFAMNSLEAQRSNGVYVIDGNEIQQLKAYGCKRVKEMLNILTGCPFS